MYNMTYPLFWSSYFPLSFQHGEYSGTLSTIALSTRSTKKTKAEAHFLQSKVQGNIKPYGRDPSIWWEPYEPENCSRLGGRIQV